MLERNLFILKKRKLSLYSAIFFICFFLIVSFFFSSHSVDYAKENNTTARVTAAPVNESQTENEKELTAFYKRIKETLTQAAATFKGDIGMTYLDLTTKKEISVNGNTEFYTASTIKVPLAMFIADKVNSGELNWEMQIPYNEKEDYEEGTGLLIYDIQPSYSLRMLQEYNIIYSDNIAKNMLYDALGGDKKARTDLYSRFFKKTPNLDNTQITSVEAATVLSELYEKKATNEEYQIIYDYLKKTVFHERMETPTTSGKVAHKIGSYNNDIHDIGIFETEKPFILTVYTKGENGIPFISQVTDQLWALQSNHYPQENTKKSLD